MIARSTIIEMIKEVINLNPTITDKELRQQTCLKFNLSMRSSKELVDLARYSLKQ